LSTHAVEGTGTAKPETDAVETTETGEPKIVLTAQRDVSGEAGETVEPTTERTQSGESALADAAAARVLTGDAASAAAEPESVVAGQRPAGATPVDVPDESTAVGARAEAAAERRRKWVLWPWLLILAAAGLGLVLGNALGSRETGLFGGSGGTTAARPTIVIAARPASSPVAVAAGSPSPMGSPVTGRPDEEYVVEVGDSLRSIAQRLYGDDELWSRVYERNRDVIGADPNALRPGMRLRIPRD